MHTACVRVTTPAPKYLTGVSGEDAVDVRVMGECPGRTQKDVEGHCNFDQIHFAGFIFLKTTNRETYQTNFISKY